MTGEHASYTRANFLADLESVMKSVNPTDVFMTSRYDMHYDHASSIVSPNVNLTYEYFFSVIDSSKVLSV